MTADINNNAQNDALSFEERLAVLEKKVAQDQRLSKIRRKKEGNKPVQNLSSVLPALQHALGLDEKVKQLALLSVWTAIVAPRFREVTRPLMVKTEGHRRILVVAVAHGAIGTELSFMTTELKAKLNTYTPQTGLSVDDIRFQVQRF